MTKTRQRDALIDLGFDRTCILREGFLKVRCSQCEALFINGIATHEHGCPNALHECQGCNELVPVNVRYCEECR
jgi:hypothetical protein